MTENSFYYLPHPIAELFPLMSGAEFLELKEDIKAHGLLIPIILYEGLILDGRNRFKACQETDIPIRTVEYTGLNPVSDVISMNLKRRHLNSDQRACIAVDALPFFEAEAKKRQVEAGKLYGENHPQEVSQKIGKALVTDGTKQKNKVNHANCASQQAAEQFSTNRQYVDDAKKLKAENRELFEQIKSGSVKLIQAKREIKETNRESARQENRKKIIANMEDKPIMELDIRFPTIVIDPPWDWGDEGDKDQLGRAKPDYHTLSFEELMALPVNNLAMPDAHIYLWITNRSLPKGFDLLKQWGFRYITCITWVKPSFGMGNYFRGQTEQVLFGVKGSLGLKRKDASTYFNAPRGENGHSSKPVEFYNFVESCSHGPYLEMFSRQNRVDWTSWGENGYQ
ncbi:MT-A70 family methyltransferase [Methylobacter psychrophilus]|uniref:MT-A70 family methyltransferase n=1 Tax=Methylobacter psychrophilus TaxID=96941 RepID=UPI0021D4C8C9|nr:MT-A70 family methyltransferase [Methylobacter psychrophilus]